MRRTWIKKKSLDKNREILRVFWGYVMCFCHSCAKLVLGQEQNFVDEILNKFGVGIFDFATVAKASEVGVDGQFYCCIDTVVIGKVVDF